MAPKTFGLVAHPEKPGAAELVRTMRNGFQTRGASLLLENETAALLGENDGIPASDLGKRCEMVISLGGDGALLRTVHHVWPHVVPVFGVNHGSLGFLTGVGTGELEEAISALVAGEYSVVERALLEVHVLDEDGHLIHEGIGVNDAVVTRGSLSRLIQMDVKIDGEELTRYNADGLIIATPTGSTAYSLAAGGPIIMPQCDVFLLTPICPHVLTNRSLLFNDTSVVELDPCSGQNESFLTIDGMHEIRLERGNRLRMRCASKKLPLVGMPKVPFFEVLRRKLKWSGSNV